MMDKYWISKNTFRSTTWTSSRYIAYRWIAAETVNGLWAGVMADVFCPASPNSLYGSTNTFSYFCATRFISGPVPLSRFMTNDSCVRNSVQTASVGQVWRQLSHVPFLCRYGTKMQTNNATSLWSYRRRRCTWGMRADRCFTYVSGRWVYEY